MSKFFKTVSYERALKMGPVRFVKNYLFPAMRREHGRGFGMSEWHLPVSEVSDNWPVDDIRLGDRKVPACETVMCIGGTMHAITGVPTKAALAALLGLPLESDDGNDADHLFYDWTADVGPWAGLSEKFLAAKTPVQKERIAEKAVLAAIKSGKRQKKEQVQE